MIEKENKNMENNRKEEKGIEPLRCLWWLIIFDFILFYITFFKIEWFSFIKDNKGIPFTLFLFVTFWIIYLRIPKKNNKTK